MAEPPGGDAGRRAEGWRVLLLMLEHEDPQPRAGAGVRGPVRLGPSTSRQGQRRFPSVQPSCSYSSSCSASRPLVSAWPAHLPSPAKPGMVRRHFCRCRQMLEYSIARRGGDGLRARVPGVGPAHASPTPAVLGRCDRVPWRLSQDLVVGLGGRRQALLACRTWPCPPASGRECVEQTPQTPARHDPRPDPELDLGARQSTLPAWCLRR